MVEPLLRTLLVVAVLALVFLAFLYLTQRNLIYFPSSVRPEPALLPAGAETIELETDDGLPLPAWFLPPAAGAPERGGAAVLVCNGNAGDRSHRLDVGLALSALGYAVVLFDYRGYAGNPGSPSEEGLRGDARAAAAALATRPEIDPGRIAYLGESLGAAVCGGLATERPPAALILRSPPPSMAEMARHHYPFLPVIEALIMDRYPLVEQLRAVEVPTLVIVTERDEVVPADLSRRVYEAAPGPKGLIVLDAAHHNDPVLFAGEQLIGEVAAFLDEHLPAP
jgi:fermentation-respiration switch protein FrsA (DUF1100 family)